MDDILDFLQIKNPDFEGTFSRTETAELRNHTLIMFVDSINSIWGTDALMEYNTLEDMATDNMHSNHLGYFFTWLKEKGLCMLQENMNNISNDYESADFFHHWHNLLKMSLFDSNSKEDVIGSIIDFINRLESFVNSETSCSQCNNTEKNTDNGLCTENKAKKEEEVSMDIYQSKTEELKSVNDSMIQLEKEWKELKAKKESLQKEAWWTNHNDSLELRSGLVLECNMHTWEVAKNNLNDGDLNFPYFLLNYDGLTIEDAKNIVEYINKVLDYLES